MRLTLQRKGTEVGKIYAMAHQIPGGLVIRMSPPPPWRTIPIRSQHDRWALLADSPRDLQAALKIVHNPAVLKIHHFHVIQPQNLGGSRQLLSANLRCPATPHFANSKVHDAGPIAPVL